MEGLGPDSVRKIDAVTAAREMLRLIDKQWVEVLEQENLTEAAQSGEIVVHLKARLKFVASVNSVELLEAILEECATR